MQSPVNLKTCPATIKGSDGKNELFNIPEERPTMALSYGATEMVIEKTGRTVGTAGYVLNLYPKSPTGTTAATNKMTVAGAEHTRTYVLNHCTARMPAEHLINGRVAPLEIQCHHTMEHTAGKKSAQGYREHIVHGFGYGYQRLRRGLRKQAGSHGWRYRREDSQGFMVTHWQRRTNQVSFLPWLANDRGLR